MLYQAYEMSHAAISPWRAAARMGLEAMSNPNNPFSQSYGARSAAASLEMFINATRRYGKPSFDITSVSIDGVDVPVVEEVVWSRPFCRLIRFRRAAPKIEKRGDPKVMMIAPMSGHYATLLRGTVTAMLPEHDVYVTDWTDAREVPMSAGDFDLDDFTDYLIAMLQHLGSDGERASVMAVCQPGVPMMVAAAMMAEDKDPARPASVILMGSPIDTACNPKQPNELATSQPLSWFENNVIMRVPWPNPGALRPVYPGFLQLTGFMTMNLDRHMDAHKTQFQNLIKGDGDSTDAHQRFYDEYMSVMDLTAEFYLQTIERVFQKRLLSENTYFHRSRHVDLSAIRDIALMSIEGENDDITGLGQTGAVHDLVPGLKPAQRQHYVQADVGHYGVFNGSRWREEIQPRVRDFIRANLARPA